MTESDVHMGDEVRPAEARRARAIRERLERVQREFAVLEHARADLRRDLDNARAAVTETEELRKRLARFGDATPEELERGYASADVDRYIDWVMLFLDMKPVSRRRPRREFSTVTWGYDRQQVDTYLDQLDATVATASAE
ncbi:hypothetical protein ACQP2E_21210 [Actinoplanes sp. CA-015351]|uniref:hypothetical protein n=1 Tax=Actinoplanes sp. CA-015351 TaxID=3239897 RepID=UPI003D98D909